MFPPFSISEKLPTIERVQYRALTEQRTMARPASNIFHGKPLRFIIHSLSLPSRRCHYNFEVGVITILKGEYLDVDRPGDRQPAYVLGQRMWALCGGLLHLLEQVDAENACCSSVTVPDGNMAAQHQILDVEACSLQDGMSFNDWVSVTLVL